MPNKMLIDATHPEETRVVVLRGNRVEEFDFESASRRPLRGNIYLAKVTRVEPSLQAAFIDYGGNRHGFLAFSEIHPDYYQIPVADRQALIDEEERAHRAADAEADRRAAARTRAVPAGRGSQRHGRVASEPVSAPEQPHGEDAIAGAAPDHAPTSEDGPIAEDAAMVPVEALASFEETAEFQTRVVEEFRPEDAPTAKRGPVEQDAHMTVVEADLLGGEPAQVEPPSSKAPEMLRVDTDGADAGAAGLEAEEPGSSEPHAREIAEPVTLQATDAAMLAAGTDPDDQVLAEREERPGDDGEGVNLTEATGVGDDGEDDNDADHGDDDDDDDELGDDAAEAEEGVEMVGGADALEEVQERTPRVRRQYKIQEVIKRRQIMLVQVVKEERGTKGAALTTYLSLAGRYSVLMPNTARGGGISRKITNSQDRNRLKEIAQDLEVPEGMGVILRTAGASRTKTEIKRDFEYLLRMWEQVRDLTLRSTAPTLVYEEGSVVKRAIRDLYSKDIDEVVVAGDEAFRETKNFMRMLMPSHAKNVKPYNENLPLLIRFGVESQLDAMFSPIVQLRSGGYIVLNQTEALVAIDVNSGRATREHHIEDTALKTNLEAAEEIARQLRLRDLAGLIVIDFIDMDEKRNNRAVERRLKECLKNDRARIQVGRISHFGLLEMSRQRLRTSVFESSTEKCPHCGGTGHMRSISSVALQCLRMLEELLLRGATHNIVVRTGADIALYMLNQKRAHLLDLEHRFQITIILKADSALAAQQPFVIEKGEQVHSLEQARALAVQPPAVLAPPASPEDDDLESDAEAGDEAVSAHDEDFAEDVERGEGEGEENGGRRRRRRRRRGGRRAEERAGTDAVAAEALAETGGDPDEADGTGGGEALGSADRDGAEPFEATGDDGEAAEAEQRRRRRRGRRGGRRNRRTEGESDAAPAIAGEDDGTGLDAESPELFKFIAPVNEMPDAEGSEAEAFVEALSQDRDDSPAQGRGGAAPDLTESAQQASGAEPFAPDFGQVALGGDDVVPTTAAESPADGSSDIVEGPGEAPPADAQVEAAPPETRRRRSTVREPVGLLLDRDAVAPPPASEEPEPRVAVDDAGAAEADQPAARRTGWWARRIMGNKG